MISPIFPLLFIVVLIFWRVVNVLIVKLFDRIEERKYADHR